MNPKTANTLQVGGTCVAAEIELDRAALDALPAEHLVPDVGLLAPGRRGKAVRLRALFEAASPDESARFVHVESADGGFTANVEIERALAEGLVIYADGDAELPAKFGGPFRLLFVDAEAETEDCSLNVKFLGQVAFEPKEGTHTARCAD